MPAQVIRGMIANTAPAHTGMARPADGSVNSLANTTTPAVATPIAMQLGNRDQNSVGGTSRTNRASQVVVEPVHGVDVAQHPPQLGHRAAG